MARSHSSVWASWDTRWPGTSEERAAMRSRSTTAPRQGGAVGQGIRRGERVRPRARRRGTPTSYFCCVGNDDDVRSVVYGESGALAGMKKGAILVDHTTASAILARELDAQARELGLGFLDAPVSGGQAGAQSGQLGVMVGGDPATFARAKPVLDLYAKSCALIGPAGSGQLCKMVNQICVAGVVQGLAEGLNFGQRAGLDMEKVLSVISKGPRDRGRWRAAGRPCARASSKVSASPWTGCARTSAFAWRKRSAAARGCRSPPCSTSSTPRSRPRREALGHLQPDQPAGEGLIRGDEVTGLAVYP